MKKGHVEWQEDREREREREREIAEDGSWGLNQLTKTHLLGTYILTFWPLRPTSSQMSTLNF